MARLSLAILVFTVQQVFVSAQIPSESNLPEGYILEVSQTCGDPDVEVTKTELQIYTDLPVRITVECRDGHTYNSTAITSVLNCVFVYFNGDPSQRCLYKDDMGTSIYTVKLLVNMDTDYGESGINREATYSMTCSYAGIGEKTSKNNSIVEQFYSPKETEAHAGILTNYTVRVMLTDVSGKPIRRDEIAIDKPICLKVFIEKQLGEVLPKNISVFPSACDVIGLQSGDRHAFIRAGCGDGMIIGKDEGFTMLPYMAVSPYFKLIYLQGEETDLRIECNFTICTDCIHKNSCDGDSTSSLFTMFEKFLRKGHRLRRDTMTSISELSGAVYAKVKRSTMLSYILETSGD